MSTPQRRATRVFSAIILAGTLGACSATQAVLPGPTPVAAIVDLGATAPASVSVSAIESMRTAMPEYDLREAGDGSSPQSVSVMRDLPFAHDSTIVGRREAERLRPFVAYLVENPAVTVRIESYGNGATPERDAELGLSRAHAVARVLQTNLRVANRIVTASGKTPHSRATQNTAVITVTMP